MSHRKKTKQDRGINASGSGAACSLQGAGESLSEGVFFQGRPAQEELALGTWGWVVGRQGSNSKSPDLEDCFRSTQPSA